jgi:peptidoglycan/xylan/chitin deacetylase (PgdA/CDA1 family)
MLLDDALPERMSARLIDDGLAIFLFHGVVRKQRHAVRNYTGKHIEADLFARCMRTLKREGRAISMHHVLHHCESATPFPPRSFAVTFDDGFENNLSVAAPILSDCNIPATIYVTSDFIDRNGMSWIDRIEYVVEDAPARILTVDWADAPFELGNAESRIRFLKAVRAKVKNDPSCNADAFADELCAELGRPGRPNSKDPLDLKMTWEQIRQAAGDDLLIFGGHSHTHAIMSFLTDAELDHEITQSLSLLASKAGVGPTHYSYPEGLSHCYSQKVIRELKSRGVRCCPTAIDGINRSGADPFELRRIMI